MKARAMAGLPQELWMCSILPRLPLRSLAKARCVCKQWRNAIFADKSCAERVTFNSEPCLVLGVGDRKIAVLMDEGGRRRWTTISVPKGLFGGLGVAKLCCMSEGLFCFSFSEGHNEAEMPLLGKLVVGNPFTNRWKVLPPVPLPRLQPPLLPNPRPSTSPTAHDDHHNLNEEEDADDNNYEDWPVDCDFWLLCGHFIGAIGMIADPDAAAYTILILAATRLSCYAFEYTSSSASWSTYQQPLNQGAAPSGFHTNITFLDGKAYYVGTITTSTCCPALASYDMVTHSWTLIAVLWQDVPFPARPVDFFRSEWCPSRWQRAQLVCCKDELRLVGEHCWQHTKSSLAAWTYWCLRVDPKRGPIFDSVDSLPSHQMKPNVCPLHRSGDFAIASSYEDPSLFWLVFNHPSSKTVCYNPTTGLATSHFKPPDKPIADFSRWACSSAFHQPLIWSAPLE